jgi:succinyldiaminopimelate transaminase
MSRIALPDFPWDSLAGAKARAGEHPGGVVDLSIGTPVDPVPGSIRDALASVSDIPGYPTTHGIPALRAAAIAALGRRHGIEGIEPDAVLPTIGFGPGDLIVIPELAYPTYEVGALLAGSSILRSDGLTALGPERPKMIWLNSPSNPTGRVLGLEHLRKVVEWARERDVVVVSDECYLALGWDSEPLSILHPSVHGGRTDGLLAVHSLSKSANLASYRAGFVTGDPDLVAGLLEVRKHAGMIVPRPVQEAMVAALTDDESLAAQRERYLRRRVVLRKALTDSGFEISHSEAGLYLWATRGEDSFTTVNWLAERGILVAPGTFYGPTGGKHVRVALTGTDERIEAAAERLAG